jgi:hypothetical protein
MKVVAVQRKVLNHEFTRMDTKKINLVKKITSLTFPVLAVSCQHEL